MSFVAGLEMDAGREVLLAEFVAWLCVHGWELASHQPMPEFPGCVQAELQQKEAHLHISLEQKDAELEELRQEVGLRL